MMKKRVLTQSLLAATCSILVNSEALADGKESSELKGTNTAIRLWAGYASYAMGGFNDKQASEGNHKIEHGMNVGLDLSFLSLDFKIPDYVPGFSGTQKLKIPLGVEYLTASSDTSHENTSVKWNLPVIGVYCAPEITLSQEPWLILRPLGIGYYMLGVLDDADLYISDRAGTLELSGSAIGVTSQVGIRVPVNNWELFAQAGYRWLTFSSVDTNPKGGFGDAPGGAPVASGKLTEDLEYSGFGVIAGITWRF